MKQAAAALVVLMSLLLAHEPQHAAAIYQPEDVLLSWNLLDEPIDTLLQKMHVILADNKPRLTIGGHAVLAPKDAAPGSPPCRWLKVTIFAGNCFFRLLPFNYEKFINLLTFGDSPLF